MKEQHDKYTKILVEDLYKYSGASIIQNILISHEDLKAPIIKPQFEYPYIFEGIAFAIVLKGSGKIKINLVEYDIEPNIVITIIPNSVIEFIEKGDDVVAEFLIFSPEFLLDLRLPPNMDYAEKIETIPCLKITEEECKHLLEFHSFIVKQYKRTEHQYRVELVKTLLLAMLIEIASIYKIPRNDSQPQVLSHKADLLRKLTRLLFKHHRKERSVTFYANEMCLTPKYLSKVIKEISGKSISSWIDDAVIGTSKALLKSTTMTILQISEDLNFPNPSFFGRYFKKYTGITPKSYRDKQ